MQLIYIFHIICIGLTSKITDPKLTFYEESLQQSNFSSKVRQNRTITYWNNSGIFALSLYEIDENQKKIEKNLDDLDFKENGLYQLEGCYSKQRSITINFNLQLRLEHLIQSQGTFFTDLATAANKLKAYIVRNDFQIFQIDISNGLGEIFLEQESVNFSAYLNLTQVENEFYFSHPYFIDDEGSNQIYVITEFGGVSFFTNTTISKTVLKAQNFQQRKQIYNVHKNSKAQIIIVACGVEGIDIYDISDNGIVKHQHQLLPEDLGLSGGVIIDVDSNDDETKLYLLDQESGLIVYDISDLKNIQKIIQIHLPNTKKFDHYKNTIFIVAKTNTQLDYAAEIFLDLENHTYFYNALYIDEMVINDVNVFDKYAVLIGEDGHKIIYHSIYNGFLDNSLQQHTYFQEEDLFKIKEYDFSKQYISHNRIFIGIAKYQFKYIEIGFEEPKILCSSSTQLKKTYQVAINSTSCDTKNKIQDLSPYSLCKISHQFIYEAESKPGNKKTYMNYTILMYCLIVGSIWIIVLIAYLYKKWGYKLEFLKWRKQKLIASQPLNVEQELQNQN